MRQSVVFFEVAGGNDQGPDRHRRDTMPMVGALRALGWKADAVFHDDAEFDALLERIPQQYFASHLDTGIQETVADEIVHVVSAAAG